jgi:pyruvate ferredoxin oxidoreductase gamma subunit
MFEVRIHGRGGQGVVTAAELLSVAAFADGRHSQAFPSFGSERTGAPVVAFCRISEQPIRTREPVIEPDALVVQDVTLIHQVDLLSGLRADGYLIVNTSRTLEELGMSEVTRFLASNRLITVPATELALEYTGRPVPNAVMLGALSALTGRISLTSVTKAIGGRFVGAGGDANAEAAAQAYQLVLRQREEMLGAPPG